MLILTKYQDFVKITRVLLLVVMLLWFKNSHRVLLTDGIAEHWGQSGYSPVMNNSPHIAQPAPFMNTQVRESHLQQLQISNSVTDKLK